MKFKVGDIVRIIGEDKSWEIEISEQNLMGKGPRYWGKRDDGVRKKELFAAYECNLELVKSK